MSTFDFQINILGNSIPASLRFANKQDLSRYHRTLSHGADKNSPLATDAVEFTRLAAKRWRYYYETGEAAESLEQLQQVLRRKKRSEVAFIMIATAKVAGHEQPIGLAYCRRTWCHHLALDFLAAHPRTLDEGEKVRGVGSGILFALVKLAKWLKIGQIWGEATVHSAGFYESLLAYSPVLDLFVIRSREMSAIEKRQSKIL